MNRNHITRTLRTIKNTHTNNNKNKSLVASKSPASKSPASKSPASKSPANKTQTNNKSDPNEVRRTSPKEVRLGSTSNNIRAKLSEPVEELLVFDDSDDSCDNRNSCENNARRVNSYENPVENSLGKSVKTVGVPRNSVKTVEVTRKVRVVGQTSGSHQAPINKSIESASAGVNVSANASASARQSTGSKTSPGPVLDKQAMEAIYAQSIDLIYECDPDQSCSKEELIERLERKRDRLPEDHSDRIAFNHLLKELIAEEREQKITNMNQTRSQQDLIVKKNKLKPEHFKGKTNLTPSDEEYKELGEDEQLKIFKTSKKYFEKVREYKALPKSLADPFSKGKMRGNRKPPPELFNSIAAKFA